jgi:hypothetical protein
MNRQQQKERNLKIIEDYQSGMEVKVIAIKYNISKCMISHIIKPLDIPKGRYRTASGKCKNHPDKQAVKGTLLCPECKKKYMREYARAHRGNRPRIRKIRMIEKYTAPFIREELPERLEKIREKYRNLGDKEVLMGTRIRISDFDYSALPKFKTNYSGMIWR